MRTITYKISSFLIFLFFLQSLQFYCSAQSTKLFYPRIGDGADPWIIKYKEFYYEISSVNNGPDNFITISKSPRLSKLGVPIIVWHAPKIGWNASNIWAPELHLINHKWYIYYAAGKSGPPFIYQRSGVLESFGDNPQGPYTDKGMLKTGIDMKDSTGTIWAIDLTVAKINSELYAVWSGWDKNESTDNTQQNLYIAKMINPWTIDSDRVLLSTPNEKWEIGGTLNLQEGPEFLQHKNEIFIIYSTRESWTSAYRLGQLKFVGRDKNLLNPDHWTKSGPIFCGKDSVFGVGHASFTKSPDNKEWWIVYHTKKSSAPGWSREIHLQPFLWDKSGNPEFGLPAQPNVLIKIPSGEKL